MLWTGLEKVVVYGVGFLQGIVLARLLSPQDFGLAAMLGIFTGIGGVLAESGLGTALVVKASGRDSASDLAALRWNVGVALALACAFSAASPLVAKWFGADVLCPLLVALSAAISDGLHDVPCAETIMPFWNEGCAVRAADCIYNSGRNRELMAFLRMNLRSILFDARLGMSVKAKSMRLCRKMTYCPYLRDGRLYTCAQAYHIKDYIKLYETETGNQGKMTASAGLDVHDEANDGWTILRYLMTPCETCRFCADRVRGIPWTQGFRSVRDWEVG